MLTNEQLMQVIPFDSVDLPDLGEKASGKVRDIYQRSQSDGQLILITTDRVSAFDRVLGTIPYKGQVLNQLSAWWFAQTRDIVANHLIAVPDPNVTIAQQVQPLPVEVIVRGYITGVTSTSLWTLYAQGERTPYGIPLSDGLQRNDPLPQPIITPTTKATGGAHDERLTRDEIINKQLVMPEIWEQVEAAALAIFARGQEIASRAGLVLVDTKYEFGLDSENRLMLIDEIHTPDSSRYWLTGSYEADGEPENFDKEFLRRWFIQQGYRGEGVPPAMPPDFQAQVAARYIAAYEKLTGKPFAPAATPANERIVQTLTAYFQATSIEIDRNAG
ncbi:MAG: phosphoribosylaminoimidazolesuccinocarboxamide synthase [Chloroflexota bacterium]